MIYTYVDTKNKLRSSHVKCSGEMPSCERCLRKGKQCGGYYTSGNTREQGQLAAARDNACNNSAAVTLQSLEQDGKDCQVPAPWNDAWDLSVDQGLQENTTANYSTWVNDARTCSVDSPVQYPVQPRESSRPADDFQGDEVRSRDLKALQEHGIIVCVLRKWLEIKHPEYC